MYCIDGIVGIVVGDNGWRAIKNVNTGGCMFKFKYVYSWNCGGRQVVKIHYWELSNSLLRILTKNEHTSTSYRCFLQFWTNNIRAHTNKWWIIRPNIY